MEDELLIREISNPIYRAKGWMKFVGVLTIIGGLLSALSLVGILVAWIPIWMGILLFQAGNAIEIAESSGDKESLIQSLSKLRLYFTVTGIMTLISLAFVFLMIIALMFMGFAGLNFMNFMNQLP